MELIKIIFFYAYLLIGLTLNYIFYKNNKIEKMKQTVIKKNSYNYTLDNNKYTKKNFLTKSELTFYNKLKKLEPQYKVIPQINLSTIINKPNSNNRLDLFRNIDFGIFDHNLQTPLLLIELNDLTHNQPDRIRRDKNVKEICNKANIKLITFYTNYPNEENYVLNRIIKEIKK